MNYHRKIKDMVKQSRSDQIVTVKCVMNQLPTGYARYGWFVDWTANMTVAGTNQRRLLTNRMMIMRQIN